MMPVTAGKRTNRALRRQRCVELAAQGRTYDEIAATVGFSHRSAARKAVIAALSEVTVESVTNYRNVEIARLDALQAAIWPDALDGDVTAVDRVLKVIAARCRLLGLDQHDNNQGGVGGATLVSPEWQGPPVDHRA